MLESARARILLAAAVVAGGACGPIGPSGREGPAGAAALRQRPVVAVSEPAPSDRATDTTDTTPRRAIALPALTVPPPANAVPRPANSAPGLDQPSRATLDSLARRAGAMRPVSSFLIWRSGELLLERYYRGMRADRVVNLKSVSKTILSPLVGIAMRDGLLEGLDQPLSELLPEDLEAIARRSGYDDRKATISLGDLLAMRSGLETTSFGNYGAWVSSRNWVRDQLARPLECTPGRCYRYSTGITHLLSAILTRASGESLREFAQDRLFGPMGIRLSSWDRDPQGRYLGGNNMGLRPIELLRFGQLFLSDGEWEGRSLVPAEWIEISWQPRSRSPWNGHGYGYLWWIEDFGGEPAYFAWGYGGQYLVLVPTLDLAVVVTSSLARTERGHTRRLRRFFDREVVPIFSASPAAVSR